MTSPVAPNYARALVELMKEQKLLDITRETAENLISYLKNSEITLFLNHPKVPNVEKKALFDKLLPPGTPQEFINLMNLIVDRGRQHFLIKILEKIVQLSILEQGYEIVTFVSPQPLTIAEQRSYLKELEALWQIKIFPEYRVNPNILGGIVIQRGDKLYDGSLNGQLSKIKKILINQL